MASLLTPFTSPRPPPEHCQTPQKGAAPPPPPVCSHEEELRNPDKSFLHDSCNAFEKAGKHTAGILDGPVICDSEMISHYQTDTQPEVCPLLLWKHRLVTHPSLKVFKVHCFSCWLTTISNRWKWTCNNKFLKCLFGTNKCSSASSLQFQR